MKSAFLLYGANFSVLDHKLLGKPKEKVWTLSPGEGKG